MRTVDITAQEAEDVFEILDHAHQGWVYMEDFTLAAARMHDAPQGYDLLALDKRATQMESAVDAIAGKLQHMGDLALATNAQIQDLGQLVEQLGLSLRNPYSG